MATFNVTIIYNGPATEVDREGDSIFRFFVPQNSYVDTAVYTEGYANEEQVGDKGTYGKSIYATNVDGFGEFKGLAPMKSTTVKFAMFERAVLAAIDAEKAGEENTGVTFEIEGYEEKLYWEQMGDNMKDMGFATTIADGQ